MAEESLRSITEHSAFVGKELDKVFVENLKLTQYLSDLAGVAGNLGKDKLSTQVSHAITIHDELAVMISSATAQAATLTGCLETMCEDLE